MAYVYAFRQVKDKLEEKVESEEKRMAYGNGELPNGGWIPVSERLPNLDDYTGSKVWQKKVLITGYLSFDDTKGLFVSEAFVKDVIYNCVHDTVIIAWMPLPEPYIKQEPSILDTMEQEFGKDWDKPQEEEDLSQYTDNIELVIKIDKNTYNNFVCNEYSRVDVIAIHNALVNGTPLSKEHGRLIDADVLGKKLYKYTEAPYQYALTVFNESQTIIEADIESDGGDDIINKSAYLSNIPKES